VLPSTSEPWGLVVNEALSYGCPVVVSNVCGCVPELVIDNVTGFQYQVGNVDQLAHRMISVAHTFLDYEVVAKKCINHIASFSPENAAQQILYGCKQILKEF
jgi:glycosyltransferase involved in cell wall biosynthesis